MSREAVESILGKAMTNGQFRDALFANPDEVLAEYDLTADEVTALRAIDFETMESFAGTLDERISKMGMGGFFNLFDVGGSPDAAVPPDSVQDGLADGLSTGGAVFPIRE
jgi:hypothetical protein